MAVTKVSRGKMGRVFSPHRQLQFSLRLERACITHLGGTLFCGSASLLYRPLRPSLYSYYPPDLDLAMKVNLNPV